MSRNQKILESKIIADRERKEVLMKRAGDAGLLHEHNELPPENVEQKDVDKSVAYTFLSMVPYTHAWYESRSAETEMDDLQKIRIERAKANDLLAMTHMGKHEEALATLRSETNRDFFFFNQLRTKMEAEGSYVSKVPDLNPFDKLGKGKSRNRIKKAHAAGFALIVDKVVTIKINKQDSVLSFNSRRLPMSTPCSWKGKSKEGEYLMCTNLRLADVTKPYKDNTGTELHELFTVCGFHMLECIGDHPAEERPIKIKFPNDEGFCTECFFQKKKRKPPVVNPLKMPGVCPAVLKAPSKIDEDNDEEVEAEKNKVTIDLSRFTEKTKCCWKASKFEESVREYDCLNFVMKNPETQVFTPTCGYHTKKCMRRHDSDEGVIHIPNSFGLCTMHYTAEYGKAPPTLPPPYPGMKARVGKNAWKIKAGHWAAPNWKPLEHINAAEYEEPDLSEDFISKSIAYGKTLLYNRRVRLNGPRAARVIQRFYRRYRVRFLHVALKMQSNLTLRLHCIITIQSQIRRYLRNKYATQLKNKIFKAVQKIQAIFRGFKLRIKLKRKWASNRIKKFMKKIIFFKFKDVVITIMQLKLFFRKRVSALIIIQKTWRGFKLRLDLFRFKLMNFIWNRSSKLISKKYRKYVNRKRLWRPPTEEKIRELQGKTLARLIYEMYGQYCDRVDEGALKENSALEGQRIIRGYLGRIGSSKLKDIRDDIRAWCQPHYATDYLADLLKNKYFYVPEVIVGTAAPDPLPPYLRKFLDQKNSKGLVEISTISEALHQWYEFDHLTLLPSEKTALINRFKIPGTSKIAILELEGYFHMHTLPCRKHGRRICGDCYFYRECGQPKCACTAMKHGATAHAVCGNCNHAPSLHRKCPLQIKKDISKVSVSSILNVPRDPDMSIPSTLEGVSLSEVLIQPPDKDIFRNEAIFSLQRSKMNATNTFALNMSLEQQLSYSEVIGDQIAKMDEYWNQPSGLDMIHTSESEASLTLNVDTHNVAPGGDVSQEEFWSIVSKNPNKSLRHYDENFEHNIPLPIVHDGKLVYTFEGPRIYLNILLEIIKIEDKVHFDNPEFLRLIMNYIQIFERHWRKMVADIRSGYLNSNLNVPADILSLFQSINYPRPGLAKNLDSTFRKLGFHKKVIGKDIKLQKYAEKRHPSIANPRARRLSIPNRQPSSDMSVSFDLSRNEISSPSSPKKQQSQQLVLKKTDSLLTKSNYLPSKSKLIPINELSVTVGGNSIAFSSYSNTGKSAAISSSGSSSKSGYLKSISMAMKNGGIEELHRQEREREIQGPSRRLEKDGRRGSETDISRPVTTAELNEAFYNHETVPREKIHSLIKSDVNRYICPFPACGIVFTSQEAAFQHLSSHEQKNRLYAPTPLVDSHIQFYWPADVPWKVSKFKERRVLPGSVVCPFDKCNHISTSKELLRSHIRSHHQSASNS